MHRGVNSDKSLVIKALNSHSIKLATAWENYWSSLKAYGSNYFDKTSIHSNGG
jgi:hypothetical protein